MALYDTIGLDYANLRRPDPRIAQQIHATLTGATSVLNVGAGAGSYEPDHIAVTALEPSAEMIRQRANSVATVVQGSAENLPCPDNSFDAAMAVLTIHHWTNQPKGAQEMRRVSRGPVVFLTYDPTFLHGFWLADYFPALASLDEKIMPQMHLYETWLGPVNVTPVDVPHDCQDGFLTAYWRRPEAYLDEQVRASMSSFWAIGDTSDGLNRLSSDLSSGVWDHKYGHLRALDVLDCGYRLVVTKSV